MRRGGGEPGPGEGARAEWRGAEAARHDGERGSGSRSQARLIQEAVEQ